MRWLRSEERRVGKECQTLFLGAPKSLQMVTAAMKLKDGFSLEEKLDSILKSRDITLLTKVHTVKSKVSQDLRMDMRVGP